MRTQEFTRRAAGLATAFVAGIATTMTPAAAGSNATATMSAAKPSGDAGAVMGELQGNRGQVVLMAANRNTPYGDKGTYFTCAADGSTGYIVETNTPLSKRPTRAAVRDVVTDCSFYDVAYEDVSPPRLAFSHAASDEDCRRLMAEKPDFNTCDFVDLQMERGRREGFRIAYMGLVEQEDGGKIVMFSHSKEHNLAELEYVTASGATFDFDYARYGQFAYNPAIQDRLDARRRTASLDMN